MATSFPTGLDALTNPISTNTLASPSHAGQHTNANDAIEALQAKVGVNGSAVATSIDNILTTKAPLASPALTGTPSAPTAAAATNTTQIATTAFVTTADNLKANLASPTFTGTPTLPTGTIATTQTAGNSTTAIATTAFVTTADNLKAPLASPNFTGVVHIPTVKFGYSTTATAAGTTTLVNTSNYSQFFTGTTTQTVVLPVASTMVVGQSFVIHNNSTGNVTVNSSGGNLVSTVIAKSTVEITCILASGTTAASWDAEYTAFTTITGTGNSVLSTSPTLVTPSIGVATGTSFNSITALSSTTPIVNGTAAVGTGTTTARGDHVHPTDTSRAALASPTFTGTPTLPTGTIATTQTAGNSTTAVATTAFVTTANNLKANLASPTFTGTPTLPTGTIGTTQTAGNSTTALATTAFVTTADNLKANLASPTFTGTPAAPTAAAGTNTTQIATTAFVNKMPRGIIAVTSSISNTLTSGVVTGLTTTFTAVENRYYRISVLILSSMPVTGNRVIVTLTGASTRIADITAGAAGFDVLFGSSVQTYTAGSQTIQVTFTNIVGGNSLNSSAGVPHQLIIEDVGGV